VPFLHWTGADNTYRIGNGLTTRNEDRGGFSDAFTHVYAYRVSHRYIDPHTNPDTFPNAYSHTDADFHPGSRGEAGNHGTKPEHRGLRTALLGRHHAREDFVAGCAGFVAGVGG